MRKCKCKCGAELPSAARCEEYIQKEGFYSTGCKKAYQKVKVIKAAAKPKKVKLKKKGFKSVKISPADTAFSLCIRTAANFTCERCGNTERQMQCSHIYSRSHRTVRWAKDNAMCKCSVCHAWWHANPTESGAWFRNLVGEGFYALLTERKNEKVRVSKLEEEEIAKHYRAELKKLENGESDFESWQ